MTGETVDVPVTRAARVALVGRAFYTRHNAFRLRDDEGADIHPGTVMGPLCRFVTRPVSTPGWPFRAGVAVVSKIDGLWVLADMSAIPAFASGDFIYLVED